MVYKFFVVSVACLALLAQPAHSGDISNISSAAVNTAKNIVSFVPNILKAKAGAVVSTVGDLASIFATGMGLKVKALARGTASVKGAVADGLISIGDSLSSGANDMATAMLNNRPSSGSRLIPSVVEEIKVKAPTVVEDVVVPCDEEVVEVPVESFPISSVQLKVRPSATIVEPAERISFVTNKVSNVWNALRNAAEAKVKSAGQIFTIGEQPSVRAPVFYEIIDTPRVFQGPLVETFQIQKK